MWTVLGVLTLIGIGATGLALALDDTADVPAPPSAGRDREPTATTREDQP